MHVCMYVDHTTMVYVSYCLRTATWIHFVPFQVDKEE